MLAYRLYPNSVETSSTSSKATVHVGMEPDTRDFYLRTIEDVSLVASAVHRPLFLNGISRSLRRALAAPTEGREDSWRAFYARVACLLARAAAQQEALPAGVAGAQRRLAQFLDENEDLRYALAAPELAASGRGSASL